MGKKSSKKKRRGGAAPEASARSAPSESKEAAAAPPLGSGRIVTKKVQKPSAKEQSALAKKAARAKWSERMTAEGR